MTPTETAAILRQFIQRCVDCQFDDPHRVMEATEAAIEMIERMREIEVALREIAWSNDSAWQADRARSVLEESK